MKDAIPWQSFLPLLGLGVLSWLIAVGVALTIRWVWRR